MNANDPAFPSPALDRLAFGDCPGAAQRGMSIRAYFAAIPLGAQEFSMLKDSFFAKFPEKTTASLQELRLANADALIAELNKLSDSAEHYNKLQRESYQEFVASNVPPPKP